MTTTTARFAALLKEAASWDTRHQAMANAQTEWLLSHFVIGDSLCSFANPIDMRRWDIPKVAGEHLYTVCKWPRWKP